MSHLSLYRKFRPDTFDKMVRQEHVVRILRNQIEGGSVGHAYLFTGPRGTGKTTVARIFARAVNCENTQNGSPCGVCPTCRALAEGSLDITEIDAASNNGVNEMRDLREKVQYPPVTGRYKVYIVDEVHMLTDSAFNALLKTLEEPPAHAIFILATTEPQKIPATILSRCMRLDFKLIPEEDLEKHLKSILAEIGKPYEEEAVAAIARAGAGSDRDMLSIAEACIVYSEKLTYEAVCAVLGAADFHETARLVSDMLTADMPAAISACEKILAEGKSVGVLAKDILQLLSRVAVAKTCKNAERLLALPADLFREVKAIADRADGRAILRATEIFIKTENELRFVSTPRISLEAAIMRVSYPEADGDTDALLVRIKRLEERIGELERRPSAPVCAPAQPQPESAEPEPQPNAAAPQPQEPEVPFPEEEPVFAEAYFSDGPISPQEPPAAQRTERKAEERRETQPPAPPAPAAPPPAAEASEKRLPPTMSAEQAFGTFLRTLRKKYNNGMLFTMCADLLASFEGGKLVLVTESDTIFTILGRADNVRLMKEIFTEIGVGDYEVRKKGQTVNARSALEELRNNFKDYPIDVK